MIYLQNKQTQVIPAGLVKEAARKTLHRCSRSGGDLKIILGGDEDTHLLNRQYLGIDSPTDVLSFPSGDVDPDTKRSYLGDVIISLPRAAAQAAQRGHSLEAEVQLLVVHGVLHLLGYDHGNPDDKKKMWALQRNILVDLGLEIEILES